MKYLLLLLTLLCIHVNNTFATHNRGGFIEYRHLGGLSYEVTITTFTKISGQSATADRDRLDLDWGDGGLLEEILRVNYVLVAPDVRKNTYKGTHVYPSHGRYTLSMKDPNRNDGIININNGSSVNVPFYLEAELIIPNTNDYNNSVQYLAAPILEAELGKPFRYNVSAYDVDGDLLVYDLVTPKSDVGQVVPAYFIPYLQTAVSLDFLSGEFAWITPQVVGSYVFTVRVREYKNNVLSGTTIVDYQINVVPAVSNGQFNGPDSWQVDTNGTYSYALQPNDPIELGLGYMDNTTTVSLEAFSETLINNNGATITRDSINSGHDSLTYRWQPTAAHVRCTPYVLTFRGHSNFTGRLDKDVTVKIFVRDNTTGHCDALLNQLFVPINRIEQASASFEVTTFPNPVGKSCTFRLLSDKEEQDSDLFIIDHLGRVVHTEQFVGNEVTYDNTTLETGLYYYYIQTEDGKRSSGKLMIE